MRKIRPRAMESSKIISENLLASKLKIHLLSFCVGHGVNEKTHSIKIPLNETESEEQAGGVCARRPVLFETGLGRKPNHCPLDTRYGKSPSYGKLAFTLVELIVVIVILGVLATVGFLAFANYPKQARDTVRISHLREIEKALEFYKIKDGDYPIPTGGQTNTGTIEGYSGVVWYKGTFGEELANQIESVTKLPLDPKENTEYTYELTEDLQSYRISADLELENKENGEKEYLVANKVIIKPKSCLDILNEGKSNGNGKYTIYPNGTFMRVYCDMTTDGGGWTRYLHIKGNYTFQNAKDCWLGNIVANTNIECFNPNRFGMRAENFRIIQTVSGVGNTWTYANPNPEPSLNTQKILAIRRYLGGINYMTIFSNPHISPISDASNAVGINLGLNSNVQRELGGSNIYNHSYIEYMNYSSSSHGPTPGGRETSVNPVEIYIK